jgi:hypothetical protein
MSDLSPKTRALLDLGRLGDEPTEAEIGHNRAQLASRLGAAALGAGAVVGSVNQAAAVASVGTWTVAKGALLSGALVLAGAASWGVLQKRGASSEQAVATSASTLSPIVVDAPPALGASVRDTESAVRDTESVVRDTESTLPGVQRPAKASAASPAAGVENPAPAPSISEELELLRGAQQRLNRGEPAAALSLLSEHAQRFPSGVLWEEREASRVFALCRMGSREAARALAEKFIRRAPGSPFVERVRAACPEPSPSKAR